MDGGERPRTTGHRRVWHRAAVAVSGADLAGAAVAADPGQVSDVSAGPRRVRIVNEEPRAAVIARLDTDLGR
ncbi:putative endonuclease/exonuclease/phosphatase [Mycobacterium xenopi 4042]|uniref:Putative endonuclease/exonuclease/phosphatase n=1 Tax=Mycobacterium xenopi 4042 TaxID=1299334 RepID=X8EE94_MYCXE|nr:putative endonuclease/exonuclease/phosphatase [Mycobacterium xenopi 4042]